MMTRNKLTSLISLIDELVNETDGGSWQSKRDSLLAECSESDLTTLAEFSGWFAEDEN
jgi:hypothetical protein